MNDKEKDKMLKEMYENADECLREEGRKQREQEILKMIDLGIDGAKKAHAKDSRGLIYRACTYILEELKEKIKGEEK